MNQIDLVSGEMTHECSWQHHLKLPKTGNNLNIYQQINRMLCTQRIKTLFGSEKQWATDIMDDLPKHSAEWKKQKKQSKVSILKCIEDSS